MTNQTKEFYDISSFEEFLSSIRKQKKNVFFDVERENGEIDVYQSKCHKEVMNLSQNDFFNNCEMNGNFGREENAAVLAVLDDEEGFPVLAKYWFTLWHEDEESDYVKHNTYHLGGAL